MELAGDIIRKIPNGKFGQSFQSNCLHTDKGRIPLKGYVTLTLLKQQLRELIFRLPSFELTECIN
jgi:hypothetical protein